jgi:hypothetical protein
MFGKKWYIIGFLCFLGALGTQVWAGNARTTPIDLYLVIDSSSAMEKGKQEAVAWLCNNVVDGILQPGDRIWIWTAGAKPELVYSDTRGDDKDAVKTAIRAIRFEGDAADYRGALREVQAKTGQSGGRVSYTLLVSGSGAKDPPSREAESAGLLRYSRVDHFSGWRLLTIGLDLSPKVRQSSSYYSSRR